VSDWLLIDDGTEVNNNMLFCFTKKLETDAALREHSYHTIPWKNSVPANTQSTYRYTCMTT